MVESSKEEFVDLDHLADGLSEVRKYNPKPPKKPKKDRKKEKAEAEKNYKTPDFTQGEEPKKPKLKAGVIVLLIVSILILAGVTGYVTMVYGNIPFVTKWRNIWIETAMTTDQHKWLATSFFPDRLVKEVMGNQTNIKDVGVTDLNLVTDIYGEKSKNILGQDHLTVGETDKFGNEVFVNDIEQGIVIFKVKDTNFKGKLVLVDDPSRVILAATDYKGSRGEFICDYLEKENGIVGVNASGFVDKGGVSLGGIISGQCVSKGEYWGHYDSRFVLTGFDKDNRLIVGGISNWEDYNIRDAFQYKPTLILDGEKVVRDSAGWGMQPRTVVGQAANGVVMLLVVDGRQVGYSMGATMEDCADILLQYGAVTAAACDGGSSSVLAYDGEIINKPSTNMPTGRYLPNAWVVKRK